ncbi:MAG: hypothetical protein OEV28_00950 [Nitrospirota bacterium]|nr:hypothetical protein [Nitrospirota bacterium]
MGRRDASLLIRIINPLLIFALTIGLSACATVDVASKNQLLSKRDLSAKECYAYDTHKDNIQRNLLTAVPLGIAGLVLNPLGSLVAAVGGGIATQANARKALPTKCELTVDDAAREASIMAFSKDSTAIWRQVRSDGDLVIKATPLFQRGECFVQSIEIIREMGIPAKRFTDRIEVCKDKRGRPVIAGQPATSDNTGQLQTKEIIVGKNTAPESFP